MAIGGLVKLLPPALRPKSTPDRPSQQSTGLLTKDEIDANFPERGPNPNSEQNAESAQAWVNANFQKVKISCSTFHQNVWRSILFYVGQTWLTWDQGRRWWIPSVPEDDFTPQPRINYYAPAVDAIATNFNNIPPVECQPKECEDNDEAYKREGISRVANLIAKDITIRTGLKSDFQHTDEKPSIAGLTFVLQGGLFTYVQARDVAPIESPTLGTIPQKQVEIDIDGALDYIPRPGSHLMGGTSGTPYLHRCKRMTLAEIYNRFEVNADGDNESISGASNVYQASLNYFWVGSDLVDMTSEDSALVIETFIPPMSPKSSGVREFAKTGLYSVYINNKVRYAEDWGFPEYPITKIDYIDVPQTFFARTPAFDMIPLQEEIQSYESLIKLHGMTNAVSPWVVDANTLVGEITGRADKVVKYRSLGPGSQPPHRAQPGSLDQGVYEQRKQLQAQFDNISGAASVFRGRQEGSVTASSAIAQLRGQAELMFSRPQQNWNNGWKETIRKAVVFSKAALTPTQIVAICGGTWTQSIQDFLDCPDLDEVIEWMATAHGLPRTQDEQRQEMLELFDKGALDMKDYGVRERVYRLFGETGMGKMFTADATRARYENKQMKAGTPVAFRPAIEDLDVHYAIHTEFVKSLQFDTLPPQVQELFLAHVMETKQAMTPPPAPAPPSALAISGKLEDMPAPLVDAILEQHGIQPPPSSPATAPPPHHSTGKPQHPLSAPTGPGPHPGQHPTKGPGGSQQSTLAAQGRPTGGTTLSGQGIQNPGASQGAPPAPNGPGSTPVAPKSGVRVN